jgi:hypothetical protein
LRANDSALLVRDSARVDTVAKQAAADTVLPKKTFPYDARLQWRILEHHPYFGFNGPIASGTDAKLKQFNGKDRLFYLLVFILILFALIRRAFPKYFSDLFRLFFRTTIKQRQIREQLMQTPLPSILLNGFFVISAGLYISFLFQYFAVDPTGNFWTLYLYCCLALSGIYLVKFIALKLAGWLFNTPQAANAYIFVVFIINKMIGILLLPFLVLLAFSEGNIYLAAMTLSWCLVAGLLLYRFILTYGALRNQVRVNIFHFFLYLIAFEVVPLLLIYKALISYLVRST